MIQNLDFIEHQFLQSENGHFFSQEMQVSTLLRFLKCSLDDLEKTPGQSTTSDIRLIERDGYIFIVESKMKDGNGEVIPESLGLENSICSVIAIPQK